MGGRVTAQQRGGLLVRACLPQAFQQAGHGERVVEGDVGGGALGQRGGLLPGARLPQAVQQLGHGGRVVEGDVGGGARRPARRPAPRRLPSAGCQQLGHGARVVEGGVGGGVTAQQRGGLLPAPAFRRLSSRSATPYGSSRETWAAARSASAAACLPGARLPQAVQQPGHGLRIGRGRRGRRASASAAACSPAPAFRRLSSSAATEAGLSREAWAAGSRRSSAAACSRRPPPAGCPAARPRRPGRRGRRGRRGHGAAARRPASRRPPSAGCPAAWPRRPGRRGRRGRRPSARSERPAEVVRRVAEVVNSAEVAAGGGVFVELGCITVQAAIVGGVAERGLVAGQGVICRCGPEVGRGDLVLRGASGHADRGSPRAGTAARPGWPGCWSAAHRCPGRRTRLCRVWPGGDGCGSAARGRLCGLTV